VLLNHQDYLGLLSLDVKNQSLDRRPWDLASSLSGNLDSVTSSGCPYREGRVSEGAGAVSWAVPIEVSLLSTMVASPDSWSPLRNSSQGRMFSPLHFVPLPPVTKT
jgi:hypothetical protein